jgi:cell division septation protein DedD
MEKTYFDIRVTFVHVVVLLVAVIAIGIFLFYMGYQAGHRLGDQPAAVVNENIQAEPATVNPEKLSQVDEQPVKTVIDQATPKQSIPEEMKLHEKQLPEKLPPTTKMNVSADQNYSIQVGAFADFANAQKYSEKFAKLGYQSEIIVETINKKKLHTVQIGSFVSLAEAQKEKDRLESLEKKKFEIKKGH